MGSIGKILGYVLLFFNAVIAVLMLVSAYSPHINPQSHPFWACAGLFFPVWLLLNLLFLCFWLVVYIRYAFLPVLAMILCWGTIRDYCPINGWGREAPENSIKLLTYNTRAFALKAPHTKEKPNEVLEYLQKSDADIICLQEYIWGGKLKRKDIDYALRSYPYKHYLPLGKGMNGLACYSRYPILSAKQLKSTARLHGSVAYRLKVDNDTLLLINNHLESNKILMSDVEIYQDMVDDPDGEKIYGGMQKLMGKMAKATRIRAEQVDVLAEAVENAPEKHIVVCGDFNDTPVSYAHHMLTRTLKDAFAEAGNGLGISFNQHRMFFRIDHILLSRGLNVHECVVDDTTDASDHYPVWCSISIK